MRVRRFHGEASGELKLVTACGGARPPDAIWTLSAPGGDEKEFGKHPTQKPVALIERCLLASTNEGDLVLNPFLGGCTTAIAAIRLKRMRLTGYVGFGIKYCMRLTKHVYGSCGFSRERRALAARRRTNWKNSLFCVQQIRGDDDRENHHNCDHDERDEVQ